MAVTRTQLMDGVYLTYHPARKFKTSLLSAQFITPLQRQTAGANALIATVLRRGTVTYPDMGALSAKMDHLYGASVDYTVRKKGETQCVGFVANFIDDSFTPGGERLLEPMASLLGEIICDPATERGRFVQSYFESEKTNLVDAINSIINDKRDYADRRLLETMCAGEAYAVSRMGSAEDVEKLQLRKLYAQYKEMIATSRLELFYSGSASRERVEQALLSAFSTLSRESVRETSPGLAHVGREEVQYVTDEMDVTQGKLGMGFSCGSQDGTALLVGNTVFGGNSNAKLFMNVREKLSLCYYASSLLHRRKKVITVSSGIEFANYQRACDEILAQLDAVKRGELEDWELVSAKKMLLGAYRSVGDSQSKLENFYLSQAAINGSETPESLARRVEEVTPERIFAAMDTVKLDTVYFLRGKEDRG